MATPASALTFVRSALPEDGKALFKPEATLWRGDDGSTLWLLPTDVMSAGLIERLREGLEHERQHGVTRDEPRGDVRWATATAVEVTGSVEHGSIRAPTPVGGHTDEWRWDFVQDGEAVIVAVTNRPAIDKALTEHRACPQLQQAALPLEILLAVAKMASPS